MDFLKRFAPCGCIKVQPVGNDATVNENVTVTIKTTCCRKQKIVNINISPNDINTIKDLKEIIDRLENNAIAQDMRRKSEL